MLCNAYAYVPTLNLGMIGRTPRDRRYSLGQLTAILRLPDRILQAQVFSYRSLLTFKLMKEAPIAFLEARRMLQAMMPNFAILGIHHADRPGPEKYCVLHRGSPDRLEVRYRQTAAPQGSHVQHHGQRRPRRCERAAPAVVAPPPPLAPPSLRISAAR
jgi:hypothetical protein